MGNNPSRAVQQHQQSASSSASASPPNAPTRAPSFTYRRPGYRRNSLQPPASAKHVPYIPEGTAAGRLPQQYESVDSLLPSENLPYTPQPRRESIAETIPESGYSDFPRRTREELLEDAATLKLFPSPPMNQDREPNPTTATANNDNTPGPFSHHVNPFAQSGSNQPAALTGRRGSIDSNTASVEDDIPETDTRAIPTVVQWPHGGNKVYLTGTFCGWAKRYRLTRNSGDNMMSAVVAIPPGTHHVKFLVDGEMRTSPALPTAVDDTGILVNYLEVSSDDLPPLGRQSSSHSHGGDPKTSSASDRLPGTAKAEAQLRYTQEIPAYLRDFVENYGGDEDIRGMDGAPPPPSLPMMLQKVILNTSSQKKDDASVLMIPNHAVLNHLATSSIKNSILAVSATTRYKKKYVTTILYKAASGKD